MELDEDIKACVEYDDTKIRSLDLPALKKILPVFDQKHNTDSRHLENLVKDRNQLRQTLGSLEIEKNQLEKLLKKKYHIYEEIETRGTKVQKELSNTKLFCPIYEIRMNRFLDELSADTDRNKPKEDSGDDSTPPPRWLQLEENLLERKRDLETTVKENQEKIDKFVDKYLN